MLIDRDEQRRRIVAERCRRSLSAFVQTFWHVIDPQPLVWSWHMDAICNHLQAVTEGKIRRLIICIPPGHAKCLSLSTLVSLEDGSLKAAGEVVPGDRVVSCNMPESRICFDTVLAAEKTGIKRLYRVKLSDGTSVDATADHRLMSFGGWTQLRDLKIGDALCVIGRHPAPLSGKSDTDLAFLAALWLANGSKGMACYTFSTGNESIVSRCQEVADRRKWNLNPIRSSDLTWGLSGQHAAGELPTDFLRSIGLYKRYTSRTIRIPDEIFRLDNESVAEFIKTYFSCDGGISFDARQLSVSSISRDIVDGIHRLLKRFGIKSSVSTGTIDFKGEDYDYHKCTISGYSNISLFRDKIGLYGKQERLNDMIETMSICTASRDYPPGWRSMLVKTTSWHRFSAPNQLRIDKPGWTDERKVRVAAENEGNEDLLSLLDSGLQWREILDIEDIGEHETVDLQTSSYNCFFANGVLSHNSMLVSVMWGAWQWINYPGLRELYGSYEETLTFRDSVRMRDLVRSPLYQAMFHPDWQIRRDVDSKGYFANTKGGSRRTYYMRSSKTTGWRGSHVIVDDPLSAQDRYNPSVKRAVIDTWEKVLSTRVNDPETAAFVVIMQRLAPDDLVGYLIDKYGDKWVQLILPTYFDPARRCVTPIFQDPRTEPGELLFPAMFPQTAIDDAELVLGPVDFAAQHLHKPVPSGGNRFQAEFFQFWEYAGSTLLVKLKHRNNTEELIRIDYCSTFITVDVATSEKRSADYTSIGLWAITGKSELILLERLSMQKGEPDIIAAVCGLFEDRRWGLRRPSWVGVEANGPGLPIAQALKARGLPTQEIHISKDKIVMSATAVVRMQGGMIFLPDYATASWMHEFVAQLTSFPGCPHDDDVSMLSLAANSVYDGMGARITGVHTIPTGEKRDLTRRRADLAAKGMFGTKNHQPQ